MKKFISLMLAIVLMSVTFNIPIVNSAGLSSASAYNVNITGNLVVGQVLTANYTYFDATGKPEVTEGVQYQWYRKNKNVYAEIVNATNKTYTLTAADAVGGTSEYIYVTVQTKNADGLGEIAYSGAFGKVVAAKTGTPAPVITNTEIVPLNGNGSIMPGDTLRVNYGYQEPTGVAEGTCKFQWNVTINPDGSGALNTNITTRDYVVQPADYGKYIQVYVTPVTSGGAEGTQYKTIVKAAVGNLAIDSRATATSNGLYENKYPVIKKLSDGNGTIPIYTYGAGASDKPYPSMTILMDAGRLVSFDSFYIQAVPNRICEPRVSYSENNVDWIVLSSLRPETSVAPKNMLPKPATIFPDDVDAVNISKKTAKTARYFKFEYDARNEDGTNGNSTLNDMWPFMSKEGFSDIFSISVDGAVLDTVTNNINLTNMTNKNLTVAEFKSSVVSADGTKKIVLDKNKTEITEGTAKVPLGGKLVIKSQNTNNTTTYNLISDAIDTSILSVSLGEIVENNINNVLVGTPFTTLLNSIVTKNGSAVKTVVKADGSAVADASNIQINTSTIEKYKIKVATADGQFFTLYNVGTTAPIYNVDFEHLDTVTKYSANGTKVIPGAKNCYWLNGSTDATVYAMGSKGLTGNALKVACTDQVVGTGQLLQYYSAEATINKTDTFSVSCDVKPTENLLVGFKGKLNALDKTGTFINNQIIFSNVSNAILVGKDEKVVVNYVPDTWYNISYTFNVTDKKSSMWVNGVKVGTDEILNVPADNVDVTAIFPYFEVKNSDAVNGEVYFDNLLVQKVYDLNSNGQPQNNILTEEIGLYKGNTKVFALEPSTQYTVNETNVNFAGNKYLKSVMLCEEFYNDDANNTLKNTIILSNTMYNEIANAGNLYGRFTTPAALKTTYTSGNVKSQIVVKATSWTDGLIPIRTIKMWR